jgi:hypothetical protein
MGSKAGSLEVFLTLIGKTLTPSSITPYLPHMFLLVEMPERSGGCVRYYPQPASSSSSSSSSPPPPPPPWLSTLTYQLGDEQ